MKFVKQQVVKAVLGIALVSAFALPVAAQELKIGVVNLPAVIERAPQTKSAMDALQEEFAPRQREFQAKQTEYEELAAKAQKDLAVMGETERRNAERDLREMQRELTRLQNEFQEDLNLRQNGSRLLVPMRNDNQLTGIGGAVGSAFVVGVDGLHSEAAAHQ